ncbi:MAG: hypothetical protein ACT4O4_04360 [Nitrospiraceae bacterium]
MERRVWIVLCAAILGVSSLSLCHPPTPRIAKGEASASTVAAPTDTMAKDFLPAFDRVKQVVQVHNLDGLPFLDSMRSHERRNSDTRRMER